VKPPPARSVEDSDTLLDWIHDLIDELEQLRPRLRSAVRVLSRYEGLREEYEAELGKGASGSAQPLSAVESSPDGFAAA
jgi:hypothetical protein